MTAAWTAAMDAARAAAGLGWADGSGACSRPGADPEDWHPTATPEGAETGARALAACAGCPLQAPCAAYALARPDLTGIWGGWTPDQRARVRAGREPGAPGLRTTAPTPPHLAGPTSCAVCAAVDAAGPDATRGDLEAATGRGWKSVRDHLHHHRRPLPAALAPRPRPDGCPVCEDAADLAAAGATGGEIAAATGRSPGALVQHLRRHARPVPPGLHALAAARRATTPGRTP